VSTSPAQKPSDIILGAAHPAPRRWLAIAAGVALLLHVAGAAAAIKMGVADRTKTTHEKAAPLVVIDHVIDLNPPEVAPPPAPEAPPPPVEKAPPRIKQKAPVEKAPVAPAPKEVAPPDAPEPEKPPSEPPPAAQAAQVVAAEGNAPAAFAIATGSGSSYAGGTTTAHGTGTSANHTGQVGVGNGNGLSKARPPQLHSRSWPCDWPAEADDLDSDEEFVTVRVSIAASGAVQDVEVLSDPGHGFAKRASLCARSKVTFDPALDAAGQPTAGKTPPVRIRFVRSEE